MTSVDHRCLQRHREATAKAFAREGAVVLAARREGALRRVAQIEAAVVAMVALPSTSSVVGERARAMVADGRASLAHLSSWFNNAGVSLVGPVGRRPS